MHCRVANWLFASLALSSISARGAVIDQQAVFNLDSTTKDVASSPQQNYTKSIAIVGAGSAGLAALKALTDLPHEIRKNWNIVLFEQRQNVSGVWLPDPNDPHPPIVPETPLYPSLKTNTPHPTMTYPHFPFAPNTPIFPSHEYIQQYHYDFAQSFDLLRHIQFNTSVVRAAWTDGSASSGHWDLTTSDSDKTTQAVHHEHRHFDHLISANGHYHYPRIPTWPGQDEWLAANRDREILHTIWWRNGTKYTGKRIVVVGAGASARDVVLHTAAHAKKIFLSMRSGDPPSRLDQPYVPKPGISHFTQDSIVFTDGSRVSNIDAVILGTGYDLLVPYLSTSGVLTVSPDANTSTPHPTHLTTNLNYIYPLHDHIFSLCSSYPPTALAFIGLNALTPNCPTDFAQAQLVAHAIANPSLLPSRPSMLDALQKREEHYYARGYDPYRIGHRLVDVDGHGNASYAYEERLVRYLKDRGAIPDDGNPYVEHWRRLSFEEFQTLWRAWQRVEALGEREVHNWLDGIRTEEEWGDLMMRLIDWERDHD